MDSTLRRILRLVPGFLRSSLGRVVDLLCALFRAVSDVFRGILGFVSRVFHVLLRTVFLDCRGLAPTESRPTRQHRPQKNCWKLPFRFHTKGDSSSGPRVGCPIKNIVTSAKVFVPEGMAACLSSS